MSKLQKHLQNLIVDKKNIRHSLAVAAILRVILMLITYLRTGTAVMTQGDTASYLEPGRNLILHGMYTSGGLPEIDRTPGYPLFVNLTGMLFNNALTVVVCQIALSLISLILISRITTRTFRNQRAGMIAAWLYAIEPVSLMYTTRLMPETLFTALLLLVIDRLLAYRSSGKIRAIAMAGLALAAATYVRPVSYYLVFALAIGLAIITAAGKPNWWKSPAVLLLTCLPLLVLWQVRNGIETGYHGFSSIVEKNLYFYQSAEITAELNHISLLEQQSRLAYSDESRFLAIHPELRNSSQAQRLSMMHHDAATILTANRLLYLKSHMAGVGVVAFTPCAAELLELLGAYPSDHAMPRRVLNEGILHSLIVVIALHPAVAATMCVLEGILLLLYVLSVIGIGKGSADRYCLAVLIGVAMYFLLISGGAQAVGRYRLPIMPVICVLAAGGITTLQSKKRGVSTTDPTPVF
ncbi:glycosyltransferase family 39 protein [Acidicapsa ligni]|uniref:glycosyltransferase family 39 protein n=1 Tax=Acidicapsa ligni TaxID=542300 RepID=UPI0021DF6A13|nr:glycosyltransferase family 39 protein [Acidicapsa ligni]